MSVLVQLIVSASNSIIVINKVTENFLEVAGWLHKGTWNLLSLLQYSGKLLSLPLDTVSLDSWF